jgi:multidrug efflux pump
LFSYIVGGFAIGNIFIFALILNGFYRLVLKKAIAQFQTVTWPWVLHLYERTLVVALKGRNPWYILGFIIALFFLSIIVTGITKPPVLFFPNNNPTYVNVFIKMPEGTDQNVTDSVTSLVEKKVVAVRR